MSIITSPRRHNIEHDAPLVLREATAADRERLERLAELDSTTLPEGGMLVAEINGELRAAVTLDGKAEIADPFARTAEVLALLRTRADQLSRYERRPLRIVARSARRSSRSGSRALRERAAA